MKCGGDNPAKGCTKGRHAEEEGSGKVIGGTGSGGTGKGNCDVYMMDNVERQVTNINGQIFHGELKSTDTKVSGER